MELTELRKRAEDLAARCERSGSVTVTGFLSPAERYELEHRLHCDGCTLVFRGGAEDCERTMGFFLPDWMEAEALELSEYIRAVKLTAHFGTPTHRDYMGALLAMGIGREWLGDIRVDGDGAYILCRSSVAQHLSGIERVGRVSVTAEEIPLTELPARKIEINEKSFSVMSMRLDAVAAGMFDMSRTECARQITAGSVNLNYSVCLRTDAPIREGDIISVRGAGKGKVSGTGGTSRKGRLFVHAEIYK